MPVEIGELENLTILDLSKNFIVEVPYSIGNLRNLVSLNLSGNKLTKLPPELGNLKRLKNLYLGDFNLPNELTQFPIEINFLPELEILKLSGNRITEIVILDQKLDKLEQLHLDGNLIEVVPKNIGNLRNIRKLWLSGNKIKILPPEFGLLRNLTYLYLNSNEIISLPDNIGKLKNLEELELDNNKIREVPKSFGALLHLRKLSMKNNDVRELPNSFSNLIMLEEFYVDNNELSSMPEEISHLTNLKLLSLEGNQLPIPNALLQKTNQATLIIQFYEKNKDISKRKILNEARILVVGEPEVGKTSIINRLLFDSFDPGQKKESGLSIHDWTLDVGSNKMRINVWDFGGQDILFDTHQIFFSDKCLYLVVIDAREGEVAGRLEYWLKAISSFSEDSVVIIVINKIDINQLSLNQKGLKEKYGDIIFDFVETSCHNVGGTNLLKEKIRNVLIEKEQLHFEWLDRWRNVKNRIYSSDKDVITRDEYYDFCSIEGINNFHERNKLLSSLSNLGIVIHFPEYPRLKNTIIRKPVWLTSAMYKILNSNILFQNSEIVEYRQLQEILSVDQYPDDKRLFILDMMHKFELCYSIGNHREEKYLIPSLLPKEEISLENWTDVLILYYEYEFLPTIVMSRLAVKMHENIVSNHIWRNGLELSLNNNKALVIADIEDKKITIKVKGELNSRQNTLSIIQTNLNNINNDLNLSFTRKIKSNIPNIPPLDYDLLLHYEKNNEKYFLPKGSNKKILIKDILAGYRSESILDNKSELTSFSIGSISANGDVIVGTSGDVNKNIYYKIQELKSTSVDERDLIPKLINELVNQVSEEISVDQAEKFNELASELKQEIRKQSPNPTIIRRLLAVIGFVGDIDGTIELGEKAFSLAVKYSPLIIALTEAIRDLFIA